MLPFRALTGTVGNTGSNLGTIVTGASRTSPKLKDSIFAVHIAGVIRRFNQREKYADIPTSNAHWIYAKQTYHLQS